MKDALQAAVSMAWCVIVVESTIMFQLDLTSFPEETRELVDIDYIDQLSTSELLWLIHFLREYYKP